MRNAECGMTLSDFHFQEIDSLIDPMHLGRTFPLGVRMASKHAKGDVPRDHSETGLMCQTNNMTHIAYMTHIR